MEKLTQKQINLEAEKWISEQGDSRCIPMIINNYMNRGQFFWDEMKKADSLEASIKNCYAQEQKRKEELEKQHKIPLITAEFTEFLTRGAYSLAHLDYDVKRKIIKKYM